VSAAGTVQAGRAVVDVLRAEGVRFVFGLPGGHVLSIYDALYDTPEIRHVLVRHEQAAASMAAAHAQLTGEPGVCLVTAGPAARTCSRGSQRRTSGRCRSSSSPAAAPRRPRIAAQHRRSRPTASSRP
jgi:glyoxylate carboligase